MAHDVLDEHLLLAAETAAELGLITRMRLTGRPISGATMRRMWKGPCVDVRSTSRSSASSQPIVTCGLIEECSTGCT